MIERMNKTTMAKLVSAMSLTVFVGPAHDAPTRAPHAVTVRLLAPAAMLNPTIGAHLLAAAIACAFQAAGITTLEPLVAELCDVVIPCETERDAHDVRHILASNSIISMVAAAGLVMAS